MKIKMFVFSLTCLLFVSGLRADKMESSTMSQGQYVGGGIASIFLPFGIGQAIQGRYKETGWIFTVSELASNVLVASGVGLILYSIIPEAEEFVRLNPNPSA